MEYGLYVLGFLVAGMAVTLIVLWVKFCALSDESERWAENQARTILQVREDVSELLQEKREMQRTLAKLQTELEKLKQEDEACEGEKVRREILMRELNDEMEKTLKDVRDVARRCKELDERQEGELWRQ